MKLVCIVSLFICLENIVLGATSFYDFKIQWMFANPDGVGRQVLGINGVFPGPTIDVNLGDTIIVNVTNVDIKNGTGLHWHGLYQRGTPYMDGTSWVTQCPIPPGSTFTYNFTANQTGTYWYHGHTLTNYVDGLYGALIIRDPNDPYASEYDNDVILIISDWYHHLGVNLLATFMSPHNPEGEEPTPNSVLFNGVGQADCKHLNPPIITEDSDSDGHDDNEISATNNFKIKSCKSNVPPTIIPVTSGRPTRIRIINAAAFARFIVTIDGHNMDLIEADGTPTERLTVDRVIIDVAQRYSVLVHADRAPGNYKITASADPLLDFTLSGIALLQYPNITGIQPVEVAQIPNPILLNPFYIQQLQTVNAPGNVIQFIHLTMDFTDDKNINMAIINNSTYLPGTNPLLFLAATNRTILPKRNPYTIPNPGAVEIVVNNRDTGQHPFHLHGHKFAVIGLGNQGDGDYDSSNQTQVQALNLENPLWRDTATVQANSYMVLRFIADNPGTWLFHCHIEWHMEAGLAILINELPSQLPPETRFVVQSVCEVPVAPPMMDDPSSYGGLYLGSASAVASSVALCAGLAFTSVLLM